MIEIIRLYIAIVDNMNSDVSVQNLLKLVEISPRRRKKSCLVCIKGFICESGESGLVGLGVENEPVEPHTM